LYIVLVMHSFSQERRATKLIDHTRVRVVEASGCFPIDCQEVVSRIQTGESITIVGETNEHIDRFVDLVEGNCNQMIESENLGNRQRLLKPSDQTTPKQINFGETLFSI
jgi:hypothetical protein